MLFKQPDERMAALLSERLGIIAKVFYSILADFYATGFLQH